MPRSEQDAAALKQIEKGMTWVLGLQIAVVAGLLVAFGAIPESESWIRNGVLAFLYTHLVNVVYGLCWFPAEWSVVYDSRFPVARFRMVYYALWWFLTVVLAFEAFAVAHVLALHQPVWWLFVVIVLGVLVGVSFASRSRENEPVGNDLPLHDRNPNPADRNRDDVGGDNN